MICPFGEDRAKPVKSTFTRPRPCTHAPLAFCIRTSCMCTETGRYSNTLSQWQCESDVSAEFDCKRYALHRLLYGTQVVCVIIQGTSLRLQQQTSSCPEMVSLAVNCASLTKQLCRLCTLYGLRLCACVTKICCLLACWVTD